MAERYGRSDAARHSLSLQIQSWARDFDHGDEFTSLGTQLPTPQSAPSKSKDRPVVIGISLPFPPWRFTPTRIETFPGLLEYSDPWQVERHFSLNSGFKALTEGSSLIAFDASPSMIPQRVNPDMAGFLNRLRRNMRAVTDPIPGDWNRDVVQATTMDGKRIDIQFTR